MTFSHAECKKDGNRGKKKEYFVFLVVVPDLAPVALKQVTKADENAVPYGDAKSRIGQILPKGLSDAAGNECDISPAEWDDSAKADRQGSISFHLFFRSFDPFFCFWETVFKERKEPASADPTDEITYGSAG